MNSTSHFLDEIESHALYVTQEEEWIQYPANYYIFSTEGTVMRGRLILGISTSAPHMPANKVRIGSISRPVSQSTTSFEAKLHAWETLTAEALAAIHEEFAEEDVALAEMGMDDYTQILAGEGEIE